MSTIKINRRTRYGRSKKHESAPVVSDPASLVDFLGAVQALSVPILPVSREIGREILGRGLSGGIHQATADVGTVLAFKQGIPSRRECDDGEEQDWHSLVTEVTVLQHPPIRDSHHIIDILGITFSADTRDVDSGGRAWPLLVTRKATRGHLAAALIDSENPISAEERLQVLAEVAEAVFLLHSCDVAHGDLKPTNFIIDELDGELNCELIDFGSCVIKGQRRLPTSNAPWNPPEIGGDSQQALVDFETLLQADVFSLALIFAHILLPLQVLRSFGALFLREEQSDQEWENAFSRLEISKPQASDEPLPSRFFDAISNANIPSPQKELLNAIIQHALLPPAGRRSMPWDEIFCFTEDHLSVGLKQVLDAKSTSSVGPPPLGSSGNEHEKHAVFRINNVLGELDDTDYLVRQTILRAMERKAQSSFCIQCRKKYSFEVAVCYEIGFGNPSIESQKDKFLASSGMSQHDVEKAISSISRDYQGTNKVSESVLRELSLGFLQASNRVMEYQRSRRLLDAERSLKSEIEARGRAFGLEHRCLARLMEEIAHIHLKQSSWAKAAEYQQRASEILRGYGENHPMHLCARLKLADIWCQQGFLLEAEQIQQECVPKLRQILGKENPDVLSAMVLQANTKLAQGDLDEAERIMEETVTLRRENLAPDHPVTINAEFGLLTILRLGGRQRRAIEMMREIEKKLSSILQGDTMRKVDFCIAQALLYKDMSQLDMATVKVEEAHNALDRLRVGQIDDMRLLVYQVQAVVHHANGQWREEEELLRKIMSTLGSGDERDKVTLNWPQVFLANNLVLQGRIQEAGVFLEAIERDLGPSPFAADPDKYLACLKAVATTLSSQGQEEKALEKLRAAVEAYKSKFGETHAVTIEAALLLADFWSTQHQFEKAQMQYEQMLQHLRVRPGKQAIQTLRDLALIYKRRGLFTQAIDLCVEGQKWACDAAGENSKEALAGRNVLASIYIELGDWTKAEEILSQSDHQCRDPRQAMFIKNNLLILRMRQSRHQEALEYGKEVQRLVEETSQATAQEGLEFAANVLRCRLELEGLTPDVEMRIRHNIQQQETLHANHPTTLGLMTDLAYALGNSGRLLEAKEMFDKIETLGGISESDKPFRCATLLGKRADVCFHLGRLDEAEIYERKALAIRERHLSSHHRAVLTSKANLATTLNAQGKHSEAQALLAEVLAARLQLAQDAVDPQEAAKAKFNVASVKKNLAGALLQGGDLIKSLGQFKEALDIYLALGVSGRQVEELRGVIAIMERNISDTAMTGAAIQGES